LTLFARFGLVSPIGLAVLALACGLVVTLRRIRHA